MKKINFYRFAILIGLVIGFLVIMSGCDKYEDDEFQLPASETLVIKDSYSALPNTSLLIDLNQGLRTSQPVQIQARIAPEKGVLTFMDVGMVLYEPHTDFTSGKDVFVIDIVASENGEVLDSDSVEVVMRESTEDIPCFNGALTDRLTARRGEPIEINVIVNDGYCVGQTAGAIVELFAEPNHGEVELGDLFEFVYTSDSSFTGSDDFIYSLTLIDEEGNEYISRGLVLVDVVEEYEDSVFCDGLPAANFDEYTIDVTNDALVELMNEGMLLDVLENDLICDRIENIELEITSQPASGFTVASIESETFDNGKPYKFIKLEYTGIEIVPPEFETFSYRICDSGGNCSEADVLLSYKSDPSSGGVIIKSGVITSDEVWTNQNIYLLEGQVYVGPDVSLTIEPGTIIKGNNESSEAAALIISRDAMLFAEGTPDEPIIFTTVEDEIYPGAVKGSLSADDKGLWGGLYILGRAPISGSESSDIIEDLLPKNELLEAGGNDAGHSSGILKYVSIRHTGATLSPGAESDGLFLGGVGQGTRIDHIEVYGGLDDGITFYGGNVNVTNSVVWSVDDDGYDIEQGYYGRIENFIYQGGQYSNNALEIDGPDSDDSEGFSLRYGSLNIEEDDIAMLRDGASGLIEFCHFTGIPENAFLTIQDEATSENYFSGRLIIQENVFQLFDRSISDIVQDLSDSDRDQEFKAGMSAENIVADDKAGVGVSNLEAFNWTVAAQIGILDKFY
ncbi:MAG TPA: hypothetical protein ACFCUD_08810 [Cyclobacteriaceae bacterium]